MVPDRRTEVAVVGARAFTLIELMICIAILAIFSAIPLAARDGLRAVNREADFGSALRNARGHLAELRSAPYDGLPPRRLRVPASAKVQLTSDLVVGSVQAFDLEGRPLAAPVSVDAISGLVQLESGLAGRELVLQFAYYAPDRGEAHTVPPTAPYRIRLENQPVQRIQQVRLAQGDRLTLITSRLLSDGLLELPASAAGKVVEVSYRGGRIANQISGRFLDQRLRPSTRPGRYKLLEIKENYGETAQVMRLTLLRGEP
ncbi:MAG: hypothetical protein AMXMBFR33_05040 [Candidatus Xenobia bacterium]